MTNNDLFILKEVLTSYKGKGNVKFAYFIAKNLIKLDSEVSLLKEIVKPSAEVSEFLQKKDELYLKYCVKDTEDKPVFGTDNSVTIPVENMDLFKIDALELEESYKEDINNHNIKDKQFNSLLLEQSNISLFKIELNNIPDEALELVEYLVMYDLILEE